MNLSLARAGTIPLGLLLAGLLLIPEPGNAQQGGERIVRSVIASGGSIAAPFGAFRISATLGQGIIGPVQSGNQRIYQGFWTPMQGTSGVEDERGVRVAEGGAMLRNYPNPFSGTTTIAYTLRDRGNVRLRVFDLVGSEIRMLVDGMQEPGAKEVVWDGRDSEGRDLPSGYYFYAISVEPAGNNGRITEQRTLHLAR